LNTDKRLALRIPADELRIIVRAAWQTRSFS
jgi:hypothetical protein